MTRLPKIIAVLIIPICLFFFPSAVFAQTGTITGNVTDSKTWEPIAGANIVVNELKGTGTISGPDGSFLLKVPVGSYSLKISFIGFRPVVRTDVIVKTGSEVKLSFPLSETGSELNEVTIRADYFDRSVTENDLSTVLLGVEEIRRSPGSMQDFQRILQAMAGVSYSRDKTNELLVRGGSPAENLTVLDNMEIHSTNHYPNERNSGGPINMINVALIDNIQFSTGGFTARYGDKLSSVMNITTREGSRLEAFHASLNASMAGIGAIMEGGINGGNGSWVFSVRKSYLDLLKATIGLTSVPEYYDMQFKIVYDFSKIHKLTCSGIYGNDRNNSEGETENSDPSLAGSVDSVSLFTEDVNQYQYAAGLSLKSFWKSNIYSLFTVYFNNYHFNNRSIEQFTARMYDSRGDVHRTHIIKNKTEFQDRHSNSEAAVKGEVLWNVSKVNELSFGLSVKTNDFRRHTFRCASSYRYDRANNGWNTPDDIYVMQTSSDAEYDSPLFKYLKAYLFVNNKISLSDDRLNINLGARYDYFSFSRKGNFSPRASLSFMVRRGWPNLNLAWGDYYQALSYAIYNDRYKSEVNRYLDNMYARHFVLGLEQILGEGLKLTLEGYNKEYYSIPVKEDFIRFHERTFRSEKYLSSGRQSTYGIDLLIQQKLVKDHYGTISYSRMWSRTADPRAGMEGREYPSDYEYPHILTLILGKRFSSLRDDLDKMPPVIKYASYIIPFSNDMEVSMRWRYASGRVYTPKVFLSSEQFYEGDSRWSRGNWILTDNINSERYPDYHRLDLSLSSRFNFTSWNLSVYLSIENVYNRENVASYQYNSDGTREVNRQYSLFPVLGVEVEF